MKIMVDRIVMSVIYTVALFVSTENNKSLLNNILVA